MTVEEHYLQDAVKEFRKMKVLAERALAQVSEAQLFREIDAESNSLAVIMKHLAGNMRSRWTEFLTSDGEKPDRQRDTEFELDTADTKAALLERWEDGWRRVFAAVEPLGGDDLLRPVIIRGETHTVLQAINRQLTHYAQHVGQILFLAKHLTGEKWVTLSIPRGKSEEFNEAMRKKKI
jgi:hypothetical protein